MNGDDTKSTLFRRQGWEQLVKLGDQLGEEMQKSLSKLDPKTVTKEVGLNVSPKAKKFAAEDLDKVKGRYRSALQDPTLVEKLLQISEKVAGKKHPTPKKGLQPGSSQPSQPTLPSVSSPSFAIGFPQPIESIDALPKDPPQGRWSRRGETHPILRPRKKPEVDS